MKLEYKKGNLLDSNDDVIAHGCNTLGVMGAGVALAIRNKWPDVYDAYWKFVMSELPVNRKYLLGKNHFVKMKDVTICNMFTQESVGTGIQISYDAFVKAFEALSHSMVSDNKKTLSIPKIGAGLGGGNWNIIEVIIKEAFKSTDIDVTVWEL